MHVIATAGHVDHGKSTLVRALTGMEPDRLAEEQRRGLTVDLGFGWTQVDGEVLAFVDVPGHERFVPTMLAGTGPAPAVMFVVAADEGWQAQSDEHLAALDAFGVRRGLLVVTKADRSDPAAALAVARERLAGTSLADVPADDELVLNNRRVTVRGLQTLGQDHGRIEAVARVAVNLRGVDRADVPRGDTLLTPGAWRTTHEVDVSLHGDTGLLRDPGEHRIAAGFKVVDASPPRLTGRGAARQRANELTDPRRAHLERHGAVLVNDFRTLGWSPVGTRVGDWRVAETLHQALPNHITDRFKQWTATNTLAAGMPLEALRHDLNLPEPVLRAALDQMPLTLHNGLIRDGRNALPDKVSRAVAEIETRLAATPFAAPEAADLAELGLGPRELAAAERAGRLVRLTESVVLAADALTRAAKILETLPPPFTVSDARRALGTTRRVAVPLLEKLDTEGITHRDNNGTRTIHHGD